MASTAEQNFIRQQGFPDAPDESCHARFSGLLFQPRVLGVFVLAGLLTQSAQLFLALAVLLAWNVAIPAWNPFDHLYNRLVAGPGGKPPLTPAPAPRRFAQGMAATFMLLIGLSLALGWKAVAWVAEGMLAVALLALVFGKFCLGSYLYHLARGDASFAKRTLPWARG
jgi:hypothetical protein